MKRYILTSLCTLGLSLLGAFGINQNNSEKELSMVNNTSNVNEMIADGEEQKNLPADNITLNADDAVKDTDDNAQAAAPKESIPAEDNNTDSNNIDSNNIDSNNIDSKASLSNNDNESQSVEEQNNTQVTTDKSTSDNKNVAAPLVEKKNYETEIVNSSVAPEKQTEVLAKTVSNNNSVYIYKNVDLSECDSVNDVVKELQKNGYTNITGSNIRNISSLNDILNSIQNNGSYNTGNGTPTQAPANTPAPTVKPTQAPVPTAKPTQAPTKTPTPTTKPSSTNTGTSNYANQVLQLVNQERAKAGLSAFTTNSSITAAANKRAQETVQSFSHTRPNGTSFSTALKEFNVSYRTSGENIAYGQRTPQEVVTGWMNSPGHRANILNANFNKIGIGVYQTNGVIYWTQLFTN